MQYYEGKLNHLWVDLFAFWQTSCLQGRGNSTSFLHKAVYGMAMGHRYKLDFGKYSLIHKILEGWLLQWPPGPHEAYFLMQRASCP